MKYKLIILFFFIAWIASAQNFYPLSNVGLNQTPEAMCVYKNELYVGGDFTMAGNQIVNYVTKWNGTSWHSLKTGVSTSVKSFVIHNGILYMGGSFQNAQDSSGNFIPNTKKIAGWDGANWVPLGMDAQYYSDEINAMASFQGNLYVGGQFLNIGTLPVNRVARWDGVNWHAVCTSMVDSFMSPEVRAMAIYKDELYVGGCFNIINGVAARNIARWDGTQWHSVGSGTDGCIFALFNDTINNLLFIGGGFGSIGGYNQLSAGIWDGSQYLPIESSSSCGGFSFAMYNTNVFLVGPGGCPSQYSVFSYWDGIHWNAIPQFQNGAHVLCTYNNELYLGGSFPEFSDPAMMYIARMTMPNEIEQKKNSAYFLGDNVPNPFNGITSIYYKIPPDAIKPEIRITDQSGKSVATFTILPISYKLDISVNNWAEGVYFYTLVIDGKVVETKRMVLLK